MIELPQLEEIHFIVNPHSGLPGKRKSALRWLDEHPKISAHNIHFTSAPGHATKISNDLSRQDVPLIFAVGGDGTANETASGLIDSKTVMGVIPLGSGNGIARMLNTPTDIGKIFSTLSQAKVSRIDVGLINGRIFLATSGVGFSAQVANDFSNFSFRGAVPYFWLSTKRFFRSKDKPYKIILDDKIFDIKVFEITIANGPEFGNGALIAPDAALDDGLLDLVLIGKPGIFGVVLTIMRLFRGKISADPNTRIFRGRRIELVSHESISHLHMDGEVVIVNCNTLIWKIKPSCLNILRF